MAERQEFLKLLNGFDKNPAITLREWQRVLNHILNNLSNGSYVTTDARNVSIDDAGSYFTTKHVEFALQFLAIGLYGGVTRVTTKTLSTTLTTSEFGVILFDSVADITIGLPTAVGNFQSSFFFTNINSGIVTLDPFSTQTLQGESTFNLYQDESLGVISDNANWKVRA